VTILIPAPDQQSMERRKPVTTETRMLQDHLLRSYGDKGLDTAQ